MIRRAFSLIELLIAVAIIGILAAIVLPQFENNIHQSNEATARETLRLIRSQVELYKYEHNGLYPGYYINPVGVKTQATVTTLQYQFNGTTTVKGMASSSQIPTATYKYGPYFPTMPVNPFNKMTNVVYVGSLTAFVDAANGTSSGWLYKKETGEFRLNWPGQDSQGINYVDY